MQPSGAQIMTKGADSIAESEFDQRDTDACARRRAGFEELADRRKTDAFARGEAGVGDGRLT